MRFPIALLRMAASRPWSSRSGSIVALQAYGLRFCIAPLLSALLCTLLLSALLCTLLLSALLCTMLYGGTAPAFAQRAATLPRGVLSDPPAQHFLSAKIHLARRTIEGVLRIELDAADPRSGEREWWLLLPPNRFRRPDSRGPVPNWESPPFIADQVARPGPDRYAEGGFSAGSLELLEAHGQDGQALVASLETNPLLPVGHAVEAALLRLRFPLGVATRYATLRFRVHLPQRVWEGFWNGELFLEHWHPVLAVRNAQGWVLDPWTPRPVRYAAELEIDSTGFLWIGRGFGGQAVPGVPLHMPLQDRPTSSLPVVFSRAPAIYEAPLPAELPAHPRITVLARDKQKDFAKRLGESAASILGYLHKNYAFTPPAERIVILPRGGLPGEVRLLGAMVIIPQHEYEQTVFTERVLATRIMRALAQLWFGGATLIDPERESWLRYGLGGYLALEYFEARYGEDARIHGVVDWLNPHYREHFLERPLRDLMRRGRELPLWIERSRTADPWAARVTMHLKAPLVFRSLRYLIGEAAFVRLLHRIAYEAQGRTMDRQEFVRWAEEEAGRSLSWFFRGWFAETQRLDFRVENWSERPVAEGWEVRVEVSRNLAAPLPVLLRVESESGFVQELHWENAQQEAEFVFLLDAPLQTVWIDPHEQWLELERKNNLNQAQFRLRPLFDWAKQRETLLTLRGEIGGTAVDGNYIGVGLQLALDENDSLYILPLYGERTGYSRYRIEWRHEGWLTPQLSTFFSAQHLGGVKQQELAWDWHHTLEESAGPPWGLGWRVGLLNRTLETLRYHDGVQNQLQQAARANALRVTMRVRFPGDWRWAHHAQLRWERSRYGYGSAFDYDLLRLTLLQSVWVTDRLAFEHTLLRAHTKGATPLQSRVPLGGPLQLRGYPRRLSLQFEHVGYWRGELRWVVSRSATPGAAQSRAISLFAFGGLGRGWNQGEALRARPLRRSFGIGGEVIVHLMGLFEFPLRIDFARPIGAAEYRETQVIIFQSLLF